MSIFVEIPLVEQISDNEQSSFDSDELINDFLQDKTPYEIYQHKHETNEPKPATSSC